jgi:hypothetical protein
MTAMACKEEKRTCILRSNEIIYPLVIQTSFMHDLISIGLDGQYAFNTQYAPTEVQEIFSGPQTQSIDDPQRNLQIE